MPLLLERLSENLNILMKRGRVTTNTLARQTNIPASTIKKLRNSSNINPTLSTLIPIADYFSLSIERILYDDFSVNAMGLIVKPDIYQLPVISWEESILWPQSNDIFRHKKIITEQKFSEQAFALFLNNNDHSLLPGNSFLLIEPTMQAVNNDLVLVYVPESIPVLKQLLCGGR